MSIKNQKNELDQQRELINKPISVDKISSKWVPNILIDSLLNSIKYVYNY